MRWLKHAFAVDPPGPAKPTEEQALIVDKLCREIVRRHLATPALLFLETARPLGFLGAQTLHFLGPFAQVATGSDAHRQLALFLERRGSIDFLCRRIEQLEKAATARDQISPQPAGDAQKVAAGQQEETDVTKHQR